MGLPDEPVTLTVERIDELNRKLSSLRHDVNNHLSLILAASELIRHKPQMTEQMLNTMAEQPPKIAHALVDFSAELEKAFGITRP